MRRPGELSTATAPASLSSPLPAPEAPRGSSSYTPPIPLYRHCTPQPHAATNASPSRPPPPAAGKLLAHDNSRDPRRNTSPVASSPRPPPLRQPSTAPVKAELPQHLHPDARTRTRIHAHADSNADAGTRPRHSPTHRQTRAEPARRLARTQGVLRARRNPCASRTRSPIERLASPRPIAIVPSYPRYLPVLCGPRAISPAPATLARARRWCSPRALLHRSGHS